MLPYRRSYPSHTMTATKAQISARKIAFPPIQDHHLLSSSSSSVLHLRFFRFLPLCWLASNSSCMSKKVNKWKKVLMDMTTAQSVVFFVSTVSD